MNEVKRDYYKRNIKLQYGVNKIKITQQIDRKFQSYIS